MCFKVVDTDCGEWRYNFFFSLRSASNAWLHKGCRSLQNIQERKLSYNERMRGKLKPHIIGGMTARTPTGCSPIRQLLGTSPML